MSESRKNGANLHKSILSRSRLETQLSLLRCQFAQQGTFGCRSVQQRMGSQQHGGVSQQRQAPSQPQAVEKHLPQSQLVFLIRLGWFNPGTDLLQQSLGRQRVERQESQQRFMRSGRVRELARTGTGLPATAAQFCRRRRSKPMQIIAYLVAQPLQRLALRTSCLALAHERGHQFHVRAQMRHDGHAPTLPTDPFVFGCQIAHVRHDVSWPPRPTLIAVVETGHEQATLRNIGWSDPTDQRHQQDRLRIFTPPQAEAVLFVTDEPAALASLERASAQRGAMSGIRAGVFFLKPPQAAGKSVASMSAVAFCQSAAVWIKGWRIASLICRSPMTPTQARNALRMRTSGVRWRWRNRAKSRQARCSGNTWVSRLSECTGVNRASRCTRQSCAGVNCQCGPRTARTLHRSLMKSSGMYGLSRSSNWLEPVTGKRFMVPEATHFETFRSAFEETHNFSTDHIGE